MNIFPMNREQADKHHWVVRFMRYYGYIITTLCLITGFAVGSSTVSQMLITGFSFPKLPAVMLATFVCGVIGFGIGLLISLPAWAISMCIDDLHAMRQYMQGFVTVGEHDNYHAD